MEKNHRTNKLKSSHYCACKNCKNRISDIWYELSFCTLPESGLGNLLVFKEVKESVVIEEDEEMLRKTGPHTLADILCADCNELIGYKFIAGPTPVLKEGDFLLIPKKLKRAAAEEEVDLSSILPGNPNTDTFLQDASRGDPYVKYDKKQPELKGSIKTLSQYKDYVKEYQEKYEASISIHKILEPYKELFQEYAKVYHTSKLGTERWEEIEKQIRDAFRQIMEKHQRLMRIYILLHQEIDNLKKMIKEFRIPYIADERDAKIHPIEPPSMSEFTGVMSNVYGLVTAAKTIFEDEEEYLIIITLPFVDPEKVSVDCCNNQTHGIVTISSVSTFSMPFIQKNGRTFKLADPAPEHCPPGEFKREIQLPTRIPDDAELEVYFDESGTMIEIKVPKQRTGPEEQKK